MSEAIVHELVCVNMLFRLKVAGRRDCHPCPVTRDAHAAIVRDLVLRDHALPPGGCGRGLCQWYNVLRAMDVAIV